MTGKINIKQDDFRGKSAYPLFLQKEVEQRLDQRCQSISGNDSSRNAGSGKSFAVVNNYIKQHIQKGFSIGQYGFGNDWYTADRKQTINYKNNTSDFFLWTIGDDLVSTSGYYPALQVTETTDEDNRVTTQYTDLQGRVLKFKTILLNILNSRIGDEE